MSLKHYLICYIPCPQEQTSKFKFLFSKGVPETNRLDNEKILKNSKIPNESNSPQTQSHLCKRESFQLPDALTSVHFFHFFGHS